MEQVIIEEAVWTEDIVDALIRFSEDWEQENSCWGYRRNTWEDLKGERVFLAREGGQILGYLLGHTETEEKGCSAYPKGTQLFEVSELYVIPSERSKGIGKAIMHFVRESIRDQAQVLVLTAAARNARAVLHFYLDEIGMEFYSARLFLRIQPDNPS